MNEFAKSVDATLFYQILPEWSLFFGRHGLEHVALLKAGDAANSSNPLWNKHLKAFDNWLEKRRHGEMAYLENHRELRRRPSSLLQGHQSTFVFLIPYSVGFHVRGQNAAGQMDALSVSERKAKKSSESGSLLERIARYARHKDYHKVIRRRLGQVFQELTESAESTHHIRGQFRVVVDSAPFLDRAHAHIGGLGFVGRNTMLIRPKIGSYFFIATVLSSLPPGIFGATQEKISLPYTALTCGTCTRCVDACPTGALLGDYTMDATRCISYLSIEKRGALESGQISAFQDWLFGCDICQEVCPYNYRTLDARKWIEFQDEDATLGKLSIYDVATMTRSDYESWFGGLPLTRAKYEGLVRNACYSLLAMGDRNAFDRVMILWRKRQCEGFMLGPKMEALLLHLEQVHGELKGRSRYI